MYSISRVCLGRELKEGSEKKNYIDAGHARDGTQFFSSREIEFATYSRDSTRAGALCPSLFFSSTVSRSQKSPGILGLRGDIFQYLPSVSVPGLALQALILHYINKGLKNQGCRGKQIDVVEASRYSANTRLPSLSIFLLHCVFHLRAKRYYTTGVESNIIFLRART